MYEEGVHHEQLAYAPYAALLAAFQVTSLLGVEGWNIRPVLPNGVRLPCEHPAGADGRAMLFAETTRAAPERSLGAVSVASALQRLLATGPAQHSIRAQSERTHDETGNDT